MDLFINPKSTSLLGRALSKQAPVPVLVPKLGAFLTVHGFWNYLTSVEKPDSLRYLKGKPLTNLCGELTVDRMIAYNNTQMLVLYANYLKIVQNKELLTLFMENTQPIKVAYVKDFKVRVSSLDKYWAPAFEIIKNSIDADAEPDFSDLLGSPKKISEVIEFYSNRCVIDASHMEPIVPDGELSELLTRQY